MANKDEIYGQNFCTTTGLLTATGAETVYDTTAVITFSIGGKAVTRAAVTDGVTPTTDIVTGSAITLTANKSRTVVWCLSSNATVRLIAGPIVDYTNATYTVPPAFPTVPDEYVPFAYQILRAGSTLVGTATVGSTNWNATGFTNVIQNVLVLPQRPQTS